MKKREEKNVILRFFISMTLIIVILANITVWVTDIEVVKLPQVQTVIAIFSAFIALIIAQPKKTKKGR